MPRAALLLHTPPDGAAHFDLLLAPDGPDDESAAEEAVGGLLLAFRCATRPDDAAALARGVALEHIADHRRVYLAYEGPISGGRGAVTRVAAGVVEWRRREDAAMECDIAWHGQAPARVTLTRVGDAAWTLRASAP